MGEGFRLPVWACSGCPLPLVLVGSKEIICELGVAKQKVRSLIRMKFGLFC